MRTDMLVDRRFGIVRKIAERQTPSGWPVGYRLVDSFACDTTQFCRDVADSAGAGYAFHDDARAVAAAISEAVERYCGALVPAHLRIATHTELVAAGFDAVEPTRFALFSLAQYAQPGFPFARLSADRAMAWVAGVDLATGAPVQVPACLVWPGEAVRSGTNPIIQAGLAAAPDPAHARWNALRELIERDAMTMAWTGRGPIHRVRVPIELERYAGGCSGRLSTRFYSFDADTEMPVLGAWVRDAETGYHALGMGVHPSPREAAVKALGEALQLLILLSDYDDPHGPFARAAVQAASPLKPWRAARDYRNAYREDLADVVDYGCHLQLHLDPVIAERFATELADASSADVALNDLPDGSADLAATVARLTSDGFRAIAVDVTTDDVRSAGMHVTRVLVPGYYSNSAAGLPFLGGERLSARLAGRAPRLLPLPH